MPRTDESWGVQNSRRLRLNSSPIYKSSRHRSPRLQSLIALRRDRYVVPPFADPLSPPLNPWPQSCPPQKPHGCPNKYKYNGLILCRVSLKACCKHILLLFTGAKAVAKTELPIAVVACFLRRAGLEEIGGRGLLGSGGWIEGDDGAVAEAGTFTEGGW